MATNKGKRKTEGEIKSVLSRARSLSDFYSQNGYISEERRKSLRYYRGDKFGNERRNRSQVVSRDVLDTVESIMPELMEIFVGGEQVVRFEPETEMDEQMAESATEYCNHVFFKDNEGFMILYTWIKDALIQKNGFIKVCVEEITKKRTEHWKGLNIYALQLKTEEENVEVIEQRAYRIDEQGNEQEIDGEDFDDEDTDVFYEVKLCRYETRKVNKIYNIPPEQFLISPRASSLIDPEFSGHEIDTTASDLISEYPNMKYKIDQIQGRVDLGDTEKAERWDQETFSRTEVAVDNAMRQIRETEWYVKIDEDGDKIAELRRIVTAGDNDEIILEDEEVEDHPFVDICPMPEPHKVFGMSIADLVMDIQLIKSTILRQVLDNMYQTNNQRYILSEPHMNQFTVDDFLNSSPNQGIRAKSPDAIRPLVTPPLSQDGIGMLNKLDEIKETRTGEHRNSRGLDIDRLHDTAAGISKLMDKLDKRKMLIARIIAERGLKVLFKKMLGNIVKYQEEPINIRMNDKWQDIDASNWNPDMELSVHVGIGTGNKEETIARIKEFLMIQRELISAGSPMVTEDELYSSLEDYTKASGKKNTGRYFIKPGSEDYQPKPPQPNPEAQKTQMEMQQKKYEADLKAQTELQKIEADIAIAKEKLAAEMQIAREKITNEIITGVDQPPQRPGGSVAT